jgi:hypothetical protein
MPSPVEILPLILAGWTDTIQFWPNLRKVGCAVEPLNGEQKPTQSTTIAQPIAVVYHPIIAKYWTSREIKRNLGA